MKRLRMIPVIGVPSTGISSGKAAIAISALPTLTLPTSAPSASLSKLHTQHIRHTPVTAVDLSSVVPLSVSIAQQHNEPNELEILEENMTSFYDLKMDMPSGKEPFTFDQLKGKVVLVVNVASQCGFTPQYKGLEALYNKYKDQGLVILGFPSNQFGGQEPGTDEEIADFCEINHGVTFPLMTKSDVNGDGTNEVYKWLKKEKSGLLGLSRIKWNFEKFLIDQDGKVVNRWASTTTPAAIDPEVGKLLANTPAKPTETSTAAPAAPAEPAAETTAA